MNGYDYILAKQTAWAANSGLTLVGSKGTRGRLAYTSKLEHNLFQPLLPEVRESFAGGDGGELGSTEFPGKMQAVHSSSALGVNVFQYWKSINAVPAMASLCGLCRMGSQVSFDIRFEEKYPISDKFGFHPNIDVVFHNQPSSKFKRFAVECKFSEAYGAHKHGGLKSQYFDLDDLWNDIPSLLKLSKRISPDDNEFAHLHPAQLVKHILGLKRQFGIGGFRLLYLWYDVLGDQGKQHRDEITEFSEVAKSDGIMFHSLTYQELIVSMANKLPEEHSEYARYLTQRYL
ncbi:MAG: hypothetical protein RBT11_08725 [Desulfobacterales bacterium]|nr:hypothetical protein [Desulfobacterales bacterium]